MINRAVKEESLVRLKKIKGQVGGIENLIQDERYCIDIINQVSAVTSALQQVGLIIMKRHLESCVSDAIKSGKSGPKIKELMETINRFIK